MLVNRAHQEVSLKIVYYGPGLSGKTTNLEYIYRKIDPALRGELITLKTREERTLYFDFLQLEVGRIKGLKPKFNLYTIPGQVYYAFSRKIILRGVDGIVFVADSQRDRMTENLDSLMDLEQNLIDDGFTLETFPWVLQYNKRDIPRVLPVEEMSAKLNFHRVPCLEAVASQGLGVLETLKTVIQSVVLHAQKLA